MATIDYTEADFSTSGGAVDATQLLLEFKALRPFPATTGTVTLDSMQVFEVGANPRATLETNIALTGTDITDALAVVNNHTALGPADGLTHNAEEPFGGFGRRQNFLLFSEELDNAVWADPLNNSTTVANNAIAPNGELEADQVTWTSTGLGLRQSSLGTVTGNLYTLSFWARNVSGNPAIVFDLRDNGGVAVTIDSIFRRYSITIESGAGGDFLDFTQFTTTGVFEFWGLQLTDIVDNHDHPYTKTTDTQRLAVEPGLVAENIEANVITALDTMTLAGNQVSSHTTQIVDIFSNANWPAEIIAPDGVSRVPLEAGKAYVIHTSIFLPRLLVPTVAAPAQFITKLVAPAGSQLTIFVNGDETPHIWGRNNTAFSIERLIMFDASNAFAGQGTVLFDLAGGSGSNFLLLNAGAVVSFKSIGDVLDMGLLNSLAWGHVNNRTGITLRRSGTFDASPSSIEPVIVNLGAFPQAGLRAAFSIQGPSVHAFVSGSFSRFPTDSFIHVDSAFDGTVSLLGVGYAGSAIGSFFRPDALTLGLIAEANVDKSITSFTANTNAIISVATGAFGAAFNVGAFHEWEIGDSVTHSGFSESTYNGVKTITGITSHTYVTGDAFVSDDSGTGTHDLATVVTSAQHGLKRDMTVLLGGATPGVYTGSHRIKSVAADEDSFVIPIAFSVGGTGDIKITRFTTASDHLMVQGETHTIAGTTSYNGTREILLPGTSADSTFDASVAFVADEGVIGDVSSSGLEETGIFVSTTSNGVQKDSKSIGSVVAVANTVVTAIVAINIFTDLNLNALAVAGSNIERWGSVNATTGEVTYIGLPEFSGGIKAMMSVTSSGGTQSFEFQVFVNGVVTTDAVPASIDLSASPMVEVTLIAPVQCVTGDVVRVRVRSTSSGSTEVLVENISIEIQ